LEIRKKKKKKKTFTNPSNINKWEVGSW